MLSPEQDAVETLIGDGVALEVIEACIDTLALPEEERSALWLLAWAQTATPHAHRQVMTETITAPASHGAYPPRRPPAHHEAPWSG